MIPNFKINCKICNKLLLIEFSNNELISEVIQLDVDWSYMLDCEVTPLYAGYKCLNCYK